MAQNELTNTDIPEIARLFLENDDFAICGHTSPDGDCVGSTLAVKAILDALGKRSCALVADSDFTTSQFSFMPGIEDVRFAGDVTGAPSVFVCVDVPNDKRMGPFALQVKERADKTICIDHHEFDDNDCTYRYIQPDCASTTLILWEMAKELLSTCSDEVFTDVVMRDIAICCYAGLLTDTGRFMFQNTDSLCFSSAVEMVETGIDVSRISSNLFQQKTLASIKLEAMVAQRMITLQDGRVVMSWLSQKDIESANGTNEDTEGCINVIRALKGSVIACLLKERNGAVRGSLRSKDGTNVALIASEFGGGGHMAAAGFTMDCGLDEAIETMKQRLCNVDLPATEPPFPK